MKINSQLTRDLLVLATLRETCAIFRVFSGPYSPAFSLNAEKYGPEESPNSVICLAVTEEVRKGKFHFLYNETFLFCNFLFYIHV